jgi:hypothetical protein
MAADKPCDTEAKINVLPEQIEQLLKDSEEERGKFLTVLSRSESIWLRLNNKLLRFKVSTQQLHPRRDNSKV